MAHAAEGKHGAWRAILGVLAALACLAVAGPARAGTCHWQLDKYDRYDGVIFPDSHTTYWRIPLQIEPGQTPNFRIAGALPRARYMGFMLYRTQTGNAI